MIRFSFLDLVPVFEGGSVAASLANAADLARHAEALGFHRYWLAEHHGMAGIASAATAVVIAHLGAATSTIRVGAGGIMLPNHAPLIIAEQFGTLDALHPGRVDLGLGRAPGSDRQGARALRRLPAGDKDTYPQDVLELQSYLKGDGRTGVTATPGAGADVDVWILGSSLYGARLAAALGLPYAFASQGIPDALDQALATYRREFRPSAALQRPYVAAGFNVFAAETEADAAFLASSHDQWFLALHTGGAGRMPEPVVDYRRNLPEDRRAFLSHTLQFSAIGDPAMAELSLGAFLERTRVDEILITSPVPGHAARKRSLAITADAMKRLGARQTVSAI